MTLSEYMQLEERAEAAGLIDGSACADEQSTEVDE